MGPGLVIFSGLPRLAFFTWGTDELACLGALDVAGYADVDSPAGTGWELLTVDGFFLFLGSVGRFGT